MRIRSYIIFLFTLLSAGIIPLNAQNQLPQVCGGSIVRYGVGQGLPRSVFEWSVIGGTIINYYQDSIDVLWGSQSDTNAFIQVIEHSEFDCTSDPYSARIEIITPYVDLDDEINVCEGDTQMVEVSGNYLAYRWSDQTYGSSFAAHSPGIVWLEVMDQNNCVNRDSAMVYLRANPVVDLGEDQEVCLNEVYEIDAGEDGVSYLWSTGDISSKIRVLGGNREYSVEVINEFNCSTFDTINISDCTGLEELKKGIPTAITPYKKDNLNDKFILDDIKQKYPDIEVEIFDRWGRRIFKSDVGYTEAWDGYYEGEELPMDSYYYVITENGEKRFVGSVTIVRGGSEQ